MAEASAVVWLRAPGFVCKAVRCPSDPCSVQDFICHHCQDQGVPVECFFVKCNGSLADARDTVQHGAVYSLEPRLRGGKGGFGSMLRALGAQIEKTTNREACRDLSGRRLRDVNHEKAMAEWVKQQAEREAEREQRRVERLQRKLAEPRHCFTSPDYQQQCHEMAERLEDSVLKGMQAASSKTVSAEIGEKRKRPSETKTDRGTNLGKRKCFWLGMEGLEPAEGSSSESSDDDSEEAPSTSGTSTQAPQNGVELATESPSGSQRASTLSTDSASLEEAQTPVIASENGASEDFSVAPGETAPQQHTEKEVAVEMAEIREAEEAENKELLKKEAGAAQNKERETKEMSDGERTAKVAPGKDRGSIPATGLGESQSGNADISQETMVLLAFSSAAEMEQLGLEKLKCELLARGLKCGGTLQERAARLFSVRGLAREQIDPALFAKPLKGKKK
ncbi:splicing regulator SDE2 [Erinaceus europaeus]|uniref:Replication stress response regulator SDE2 n=1 Tax=Erinaceus europaeus TaxID=9365 RepID=A0A1S3AG66_ERIEU|nr:splicing regulator SDE2 [Erinaceus europaeus]